MKELQAQEFEVVSGGLEVPPPSKAPGGGPGYLQTRIDNILASLEGRGRSYDAV